MAKIGLDMALKVALILAVISLILHGIDLTRAGLVFLVAFIVGKFVADKYFNQGLTYGVAFAVINIFTSQSLILDVIFLIAVGITITLNTIVFLVVKYLVETFWK